MEDNYHGAGDGIFGVDPRTTHFSPKNFNFFRYRQDVVGEGGISSHHWHIGYSFCVGYGYGKGGVGPSIPHLTSQKVDFFIDGGDFVSSQSREH